MGTGSSLLPNARADDFSWNPHITTCVYRPEGKRGELYCWQIIAMSLLNICNKSAAAFRRAAWRPEAVKPDNGPKHCWLIITSGFTAPYLSVNSRGPFFPVFPLSSAVDIRFCKGHLEQILSVIFRRDTTQHVQQPYIAAPPEWGTAVARAPKKPKAVLATLASPCPPQRWLSSCEQGRALGHREDGVALPLCVPMCPAW